MKKIVLGMLLLVAALSATADNILYFTYNQAARTVAYLNGQDELMIYCGYEDELPTYCIVNEVWAEQISSSFYEIWLHGFDAYTGDEIFMPIDLECIYLLTNGHIYSAASYLRFRTSRPRPTFRWEMPRYHHFVRVPRPTTYYYTFHYDVHRPGWHYANHMHVHYHPYYCRHPHHPAPMPPKPFVPGKERPGYTVDNHGGYTYTGLPLVGNITTARSETVVRNNPTGREGSRITSSRGDNTVTVTDRTTGARSTIAAPSATSTGRGASTNSTVGRGSSTTATTDNGRGSATPTRSGSTTTPTDNGRGNATPTRSGSTAVTTDNGRGSVTPTRGSSTASSRDNKKEGATSTRSSGTAARGKNKEITTSSRSNTATRNNKKESSTSPRSSVTRGVNASGDGKEATSRSSSGRSTVSEVGVRGTAGQSR